MGGGFAPRILNPLLAGHGVLIRHSVPLGTTASLSCSRLLSGAREHSWPTEDEMTTEMLWQCPWSDSINEGETTRRGSMRC